MVTLGGWVALSIRAHGLMAVGLMSLAMIVSTMMLDALNLLPVGFLVLCILSAHGSRVVYDLALAFLEKRRSKAAFQGYVSPQVLSEIMEGAVQQKHEGGEYTVCVLFSDVRDFTSRSEHQPPREIISLLNRYFDEMVACIHNNEGTVDKFIGDGQPGR